MALRGSFGYKPGLATVGFAIQRADLLLWDFTNLVFTATPATAVQPATDGAAGTVLWGIYNVLYPADGSLLPTAANQFTDGDYWVYLTDSEYSPMVVEYGIATVYHGDTAPVFPGAGGSGTDPWATPLPGSYAAGTAGAILGDNLDAKVSTRLATSGYAAPPSDYQQRGVAVTLPSPAPSGYGGGSGGGSSVTDASVQADVGTVLDARGLTQALASTLAINVDARVSSRQATGQAVTLPATPPAGYGGSGGSGAGTGSGSIAVNHNTHGADALRYVTSGNVGIAGATIWAYAATDYAAGNLGPAFVQAATTTGPDGRWQAPLMLDAGNWTLAFFEVDVWQPTYVPLTLP